MSCQRLVVHALIVRVKKKLVHCGYTYVPESPLVGAAV